MHQSVSWHFWIGRISAAKLIQESGIVSAQASTLIGAETALLLRHELRAHVSFGSEANIGHQFHDVRQRSSFSRILPQ
jgi:hypothetical protein